MEGSLTRFTALSFDVYATLIDWESGISAALGPLNARLPDTHPMKGNRKGLLALYTHFEGLLEHQFPGMPYTQLLGEVYKEMAKELGVPLDPVSSATSGEKAAFGNSVGAWPAFPDTVEALKKLAKRYKLIVLSNVDKAAFEKTRTGPLRGIEFDAVYTAQEIGSYKPDLRNFEWMIEHADQDLGVRKDGFLHVAQALKHDHVPAKKVGLKSCWIERAGSDAAIGGKLEDLKDDVELAYRFKTLGDLATAVERDFEN
ncbi:HAD-superfamily hydrolase [Xylariaceae sp. AK1471]|nr:HAD-superfamily hydrolase [Xylariaceae sp. AK1471]